MNAPVVNFHRPYFAAGVHWARVAQEAGLQGADIPKPNTGNEEKDVETLAWAKLLTDSKGWRVPVTATPDGYPGIMIGSAAPALVQFFQSLTTKEEHHDRRRLFWGLSFIPRSIKTTGIHIEVLGNPALVRSYVYDLNDRLGLYLRKNPVTDFVEGMAVLKEVYKDFLLKKAGVDDDDEETDQQLVDRALSMYANWLETRDPLCNKADYEAMGKGAKTTSNPLADRIRLIRAKAI